MTAYYYQGSPILAPLTIVSNQPMFTADTVSLKQIRTAQNAQRWELSFEVLTNDKAADQLLASVSGLASSSSIIMPQLKEVDDKRTITGIFTANGAITAGASTIPLALANGAGFLPKGSFVKFANHTKVYLLKTDWDASTTVSGPVEVYPTLRTSVPSGTTFLYGSNCTLTQFRSIDDQRGITFQDGILASPGPINLIEAI